MLRHPIRCRKVCAPKIRTNTTTTAIRISPPPKPRTSDAELFSSSALASFRRVYGADMRCDHMPTVGESNPGLHLASDFTGLIGTIRQRRGHGEIAPVRRDHRVR